MTNKMWFDAVIKQLIYHNALIHKYTQNQDKKAQSVTRPGHTNKYIIYYDIYNFIYIHKKQTISSM